jgi:hypothetical protein
MIGYKPPLSKGIFGAKDGVEILTMGEDDW